MVKCHQNDEQSNDFNYRAKAKETESWEKFRLLIFDTFRSDVVAF